MRSAATLQKRTTEITPALNGSEISPAYSKNISDWHDLAILELMTSGKVSQDPEWIAQRLGLSVEAAKKSIVRLRGLNLFELAEKKNKKQK